MAGFQHCIKESYVLLVTIMQLLLLQLLWLLLEWDVVGHQQLPQIGDRVLEAIDLVLCNRQARWSYRCGRSRGRNVTALTQRLHTGTVWRVPVSRHHVRHRRDTRQGQNRRLFCVCLATEIAARQRAIARRRAHMGRSPRPRPASARRTSAAQRACWSI